MKKIPRVIYSEITAPSLITLLVLTFVIFTREFGRLAEMLIRKNATTLTILHVVLSLLPSILIFTVPFSFLIGTLIGFSRLSADSEIVAMRAGGVSIYQMLWPVFRVGMGVLVVSLLLTFFFLPRGRWTLREIQHQIGLRPVQSEIKPRVFNEDFPEMVLYVENIELPGSTWSGVFLTDSGANDEKRIILSNQAYPIFSPDARRLQLHFSEGSIYTVTPQSPEKDSLTTFQTLDVPVHSPEIGRADIGPKRPREKNLDELFAELRRADPQTYRQSLIELHRRLALPLSTLIFVVLGVTLVGHTPWGSRGYGFLLGISIALIYYLLFATGTELAEDGALSIGIGVWGANFLLFSAAMVSLRYCQSGFRPLHHLGSRLGMIRVLQLVQRLGLALGQAFQDLLNSLRGARLSLTGVRLQLLQVIDRYMNEMFLLYFLITLAVCVSVIYLFTFFELIDDVFEHNIPNSILLDYFLYFLPHVLMLIVPISMLIATLVTFGLLERTNQITALKASGVSIYRLAVPLFILALTVSALVFVLQEYILPYANQRQDSLRNIIKGRPVQTHYQVGHNWIFGQQNRLYNYSYFDSNRKIFAEISIYELNIRENQLIGHIYAQRAEWDPNTSGWILYNGWQRTLQEGKPGRFSTFKQNRFFFTETPSYFQKEVKESSKMTYGELNQYILSLQQGGFEVDHLRTELYKKISFPMVSFIMSILGIPFAFSLGRKGALYGIATGIIIGIVYWGAFGVFGVLGSNGLLSPLLAAWGPNLLFGAGSVLLFSGIRS